MLKSSRSAPGKRPLRLSSTTVPDLTDNIVRPDDQYCAAGGFGDVFRCRYTSDGGVEEVAVKAFRFSFSVDENEHDEGKAARMIRRELGIWKRLSHPNIVPFLGTAYGFGRQGSTALVSMWMPHGTLHAFLEAHDGRLVIVDRLQLLLDIANGLDYLHSFPLVHGDLSSNNVLLDRNYNACLTDFGCASLVGELPEGLTYLNMSTVRPGTLRWAAPEHFEDQPIHTTKSDVYSFGNLALLVLSGKYPWSEVRADVAVILRLSQGLRPARPPAPPIDDRHWELIERCWSATQDRPLAEDLVSLLQQLYSAAQVPGTVGFLARMNDVMSRVPGLADPVPGRFPSCDENVLVDDSHDTRSSSPSSPTSLQAAPPSPEPRSAPPSPRSGESIVTQTFAWDDSPGQTFLEEELYKLRVKPRSSESVVTHRTWELAPVDEDENEEAHDAFTESGLPGIPDGDNSSTERRNPSPPLPPFPQETNRRDLVPSQHSQLWNSGNGTSDTTRWGLGNLRRARVPNSAIPRAHPAPTPVVSVPVPSAPPAPPAPVVPEDPLQVEALRTKGEERVALPSRNNLKVRKPEAAYWARYNDPPDAAPSTGTTNLEGIRKNGEASGDGVPKKVQKGQINALTKMLSALRR